MNLIEYLIENSRMRGQEKIIEQFYRDNLINAPQSVPQTLPRSADPKSGGIEEYITNFGTPETQTAIKDNLDAETRRDGLKMGLDYQSEYPAALTSRVKGASPTPAGNFDMVSPGNLDLNNRPNVRDGNNIATVKSMSSDFDGKEVLYPGVSRAGKILSPEDARGEYLKTGENLGTFPNPDAATKYAKELSAAQGNYYGINQQDDWRTKSDAAVSSTAASLSSILGKSPTANVAAPNTAAANASGAVPERKTLSADWVNQQAADLMKKGLKPAMAITLATNMYNQRKSADIEQQGITNIPILRDALSKAVDAGKRGDAIGYILQLQQYGVKVPEALITWADPNKQHISTETGGQSINSSFDPRTGGYSIGQVFNKTLTPHDAAVAGGVLPSGRGSRGGGTGGGAGGNGDGGGFDATKLKAAHDYAKKMLDAASPDGVFNPSEAERIFAPLASNEALQILYGLYQSAGLDNGQIATKVAGWKSGNPAVVIDNENDWGR